jgi:hypothetical protein
MLEGRTPFEAMMGNTMNISSIYKFDFYEPVWYYKENKETSRFPEPNCHIARWLGESVKPCAAASFPKATSQ